jgi:hypothetical protein
MVKAGQRASPKTLAREIMIAVTAKHQPRRMDMRFISVCTYNPTSRLPTEAEMASMHKFIVEGMKAGWLIECEGVTFGCVQE